MIQGPGIAALESAFSILSDAVTVTGLEFRGFNVAVFPSSLTFTPTDPGPANVTVTNCRFENNKLGVLVLGVSDHFRFTNNEVKVPAPADPANGGNVGIALITQDSDVLIADNNLVGPGQAGLLTSLDQLLNGTADSETALVQTVGIQQIDISIPASVRGRISGNTLSNLDLGIQSSSNFGVVTHNTATGCEIGMALSNDTDDGVTTVGHSLVSLNKSVHSSIGFVVFSGTQNTIALNDFSDNVLAGLFFVANPGGAASVRNRYGCNLGSVRNAQGNEVLEQCKRNRE